MYVTNAINDTPSTTLFIPTAIGKGMPMTPVMKSSGIFSSFVTILSNMRRTIT